MTEDVRVGARAWAGRHRGWAVLVVAVVVGLAVAISAGLAPKGDSARLSVRNPGPDGAKAVSQILGRHGVTVQDVRNYPAAVDALSDRPGATLLLFDPGGFLDRSQIEGLRAAAQRIVVVTPRLETLAALDAGITPAGVVPQSSPLLAPGCGLPDASAAGTVSGDAAFLYAGGTLCYRPAGKAAGLLASANGGALTVLGSTSIVSNRALAENGHAALVLRTLGKAEDLVWYLPGLGDASASQSPQTLDELAPAWLPFLGPWLIFVAVLAMVWRGRRLGPLVFEPLPVVVKAVETAEGRARLYHDHHALERARDNLRAGTLVRLARSLRLGTDATAGDVAEAAARHLGRNVTELTGLIEEHPGNETRLVQWSQELDKLENEVRTR